MASDDDAALEAASSDVRVKAVVRDWVAYGEWMNRPPTPDVTIGTWVLLPEKLGNARGKVVGGVGERVLNWTVHVPYGDMGNDGALVYIHKADVRVAEWQHTAAWEKMSDGS